MAIDVKTRIALQETTVLTEGKNKKRNKRKKSVKACSSLKMKIVYNDLSSTWFIEFLMVSKTFLVVVEGLCFYCSGQHCVCVFVEKSH